jgi:hypothetical protein
MNVLEHITYPEQKSEETNNNNNFMTCYWTALLLQFASSMQYLCSFSEH